MLVLMQETLHMHNDMEKKKPGSRDPEVASGVSDGIGSVTEVEEHKKAFSKASLFKNWPLMSTVIVYCVFSLQQIAYNEVCIFCLNGSSISVGSPPP